MSNYSKITDYAAKDLLLHGDAAKAIKGTEVGAEFDAIATMSATKVDSGGALGTPSSGTLTNCNGLPLSGVTDSTTEALGVGSIELGHATDTTITRTGAGAIAVEGVAVLLSGGALGTPSGGTLTNCTGLPISTGISGLGTGVSTALAINIGSAGSSVVNGGALGTPSSGTLTNCTGLPLAGVTDSTTEALGVGSLELGHSSDTTITRVSAGTIAVEGVNVYTTATGAALAGSASQNFATNALTASGGIQSISASALIGYGTGSGGTVTQTTSKGTSVTLNTPSGQITTHNAALAANTAVAFDVNCSACSATDSVSVSYVSGSTSAANYEISGVAPRSGVFGVVIRNMTAGSLSDALVLRYEVRKGSSA